MNTGGPTLQLFNESESRIPIDTKHLQTVADKVAEGEQCNFRFVEVVYVTGDEILRINREHLNRSYLTDIITFRYDEDPSNKSIEGTLFCCTPVIYEQSEEFDESPLAEFHRILIHGFLHLAGYEDTTKKEKETMTKREDYYLEELGVY